MAAGRIVVDGRPLAFEPGDSVAIAILRAGEVPGPRRHAVPRRRLRQLPGARSTASPTSGRARRRRAPGMVVAAIRRAGCRRCPSSSAGRRADAGRAWRSMSVVSRWTWRSWVAGRRARGGRRRADGPHRGRPRRRRRRRGRRRSMPARRSSSGRADGMLHVHAAEVVVATGAAEIQPVCPGNDLDGLVTARAAEALHAAGVDLGRTVAIGTPPTACRATRSTVASSGSRAIERPGQRRRDRERRRHRDDDAVDTVVLGLGRAPRDVLARMAGAGRRARRPVGRRAADDPPLPPAPTAGRSSAAASGTTVDDLDGRVGARASRELELLKRASLAGTRAVPGRRLPAAPAGLDRGPHRRRARAVHRPAGDAPDHAGRGRRRRLRRRLPAHAAPRRAPRARRADGPLRRLVAAVALRRRRRRVLGRPRGRLDRRRLRRSARWSFSGPDVVELPRAASTRATSRHHARPVALRAAAQRARPRHRRRDDPARGGDPVRADVHLRRRGQRRDVAARLDRDAGGCASTSSTARCRWRRSTSPGRCAGELLAALRPRRAAAFLGHVHADVAGVPCHVMRLGVHRRGRRSSCTTRSTARSSCGGRCMEPAPTSASGRTACRRCSGCGSRRAT